jgi:hypothetical protein
MASLNMEYQYEKINSVVRIPIDVCAHFKFDTSASFFYTGIK